MLHSRCESSVQHSKAAAARWEGMTLTRFDSHSTMKTRYQALFDSQRIQTLLRDHQGFRTWLVDASPYDGTFTVGRMWREHA